MRFSDVKVGYIYNVIFDPVRACEFSGKHLAVVLKKNNDKKTFIVMPLTTASNGEGTNKLKIGTIKNLPSSLKVSETYAVYNQIRTVNVERFIALKEGINIKECQMEKDVFHKLLFLGLKEILYSISQDEKIEILKTAYETELIFKARNLAYEIIALKKKSDSNEERIENLLAQIKELLKGITYSLDSQSIKDGIETIFIEAEKFELKK